MKDLKVISKLVLAFCALTLLLIGVGLIGLNGMSRQREVLEDFSGNILPDTRALLQIEVATTLIDDGENFLIAKGTDPRSGAETLAGFRVYRRQLDEAIAAFDHRTLISDKGRETWDRLKTLLGEWWAAHLDFERMVAAWDADPMNEALRSAATRQAIVVTTGLLDEAMNVLHQDLEGNRESADGKMKTSLAMSRHVSMISAAAIAAGALVAFLFGLTISLGITRPLQALRGAVAEMAAGRLTQNVPVARNDEFGQLSHSFNLMADHLRESFEALQISEERFRVLVEHAPEAIIVIDVDHQRVVDANSNAMQMFGRTLIELRKATVESLFPRGLPDDRRWADNVSDTTAGTLKGENGVAEASIGTARGKELTCEVRLVPLPSRNGRLIRVSLVDITDRKRSDERLRTLSQAIQQSPAMVMITDPNWTIEYVNPRFTEVTGYTLGEVEGKKPDILRSGLTPEDTYQRLFDAMAAHEVWHGDFQNRKKSGDLYVERDSISPILDGSGSVSHLVAFKEDVTDLRFMEEKLLQTEKLDSIGRLAGGVAHDFNNILAVILGNLGLLKEAEQTSIETTQTLQEIERAANRAAGLTRQLLLFSRKHVMDIKPVDVNEIVNNMTRMLRRLIGEDIDLVFKGEPTSLRVKADAGMIEQVLMNLCVNARDAMPKGGKLIIGTRRIQVGEEMASMNPEARVGAYVCLSVVDTGCGMDSETQKHIFEPFFTTKEVGKGTGLGLANVYGIVRQHNGWIQVTSAPDRGTTFEIYLPGYPDAREFQTTSVSFHPVGGTETILLVEDDQALRRSASLWLRKLGYSVIEASNGVEALELWRRVRDQVGLLLTDMVLPGGILGAELAERLMAERPTLKVIVNSGYGPDRSPVGPLVARGVAFLPKPYDPWELASAVRKSLDGDHSGAVLAGAQSEAS